ncbi:halocarboxylic acid dehydrogenase DehI family protein [Christiangramia fulva]|nr:halocarboxylic acid dehydrogenase DehI family protein [Christiangramia fulva]
MPEKVGPRMALIYKDIQNTLRVPVVNSIFRILANYPDYLEQRWKEVSPVLRTMAFEKQADEIREMALINEFSTFPELSLKNQTKIKQLIAFNDTIFYVLPKLLIITGLFYELSYGAEKRNRSEPENEDDYYYKIPFGIVKGTEKVPLIDPGKTRGNIINVFDSIKEVHDYPLISSYYRGIANWPELLQEIWDRIKSMVGTPPYEKRKQELVVFSTNGLQNLQNVIKTQHIIMPEKESEEIRHILLAFQQKFIPEMLLDLALIKANLGGGKPAIQLSL